MGLGLGQPTFLDSSSWYSGGQAAVLMVDPTYPGPLLIRASQFGGDGKSHVTLVEETLTPPAFAAEAAKERQHSVIMVSAVPTTDGGLQLQAAPSSQLW